jgi:transposase-like protein
MRRVDARRLAPEAQADLRRRVVYAVAEDGMGKSQAARTFGVTRQSIDNWLRRVEEAGPVRGLSARKRGPEPHPRLSPGQDREAVRLIRGDCPDQPAPAAVRAVDAGGGGRAAAPPLRPVGVAVDGRAVTCGAGG